MDHRRQIQEFLASRRARISPESVGLPVVGRKRRVPGLRREEVAALAGLSVDYYIRLERGALTNASDSVLNAIARALRLDETEQAHLIDLARAGQTPASPSRSRSTLPTAIAPQLQTGNTVLRTSRRTTHRTGLGLRGSSAGAAAGTDAAWRCLFRRAGAVDARQPAVRARC